jgi:hypothetical protein
MRTVLALLLLTTATPAAAGTIEPLWMLMRSMPPVAPPPMPPPRPAVGPASGSASVPAADTGPGLQCRAAIDAAERQAGIPPHLMAAIGRVESGRRTPSGDVDPWPWSIDADGVDHVYETKAEAIAAVRALQAQGVHSIDVGCMQVNLQFHPDAFASLDAAFDPVSNAEYAARFLTTLRAQTGSWETATAWYHSATPVLGTDYQRRVMAVLPVEQQHPPTPPMQPVAFATRVPMLSNRASAARFLTMPVGTVGRTLASYRARPIPIASRVALR